jgi:amidase
MGVRRPTRDDLRRIAEDRGFSLDAQQAEAYLEHLQPFLDAYDLVDSLPDNLPPVGYPRSAGSRPRVDENPHNAWAQRTVVPGAADGPLRGRTVVLKDNIMLADVPMANGSSTLEGYVPELDATVVTRVLDAGATIVGKATCESLCLSGGSHTSATGPVHNPYRRGYSAGGSSSGCAVIVALGEADLAIGCDQGGSIRMPASFCGIVGMKPTFGLVPYTGIMPIEITADHVGPMTADVAANALLLEVIAGPDGLDPRQAGVRIQRYTDALGCGVDGLHVGVLAEGFSHPATEPDVAQKVREAAAVFAGLGAQVDEVSIPWHERAGAVWAPIGVGGILHTMMEGDGFGSGRSDLYVSSLMEFHRGWRDRADELPPTVKRFLLLSTFIDEHYGTRYYGKATNLGRIVRAAYDHALSTYDVLLLPTTPMKATPLPLPDDLAAVLRRADEPTVNTMPFDLTHHPALSVPCGMSDGLPVGMMLVGRHWDESTLYRAAHAFEQAGAWRER